MANVNTKTKRRLKNALLTFGVLGIMIPLSGCQAASDLFNPDTYSWNYNREPWEKNFKRTKPSKSKNIANDY